MHFFKSQDILGAVHLWAVNGHFHHDDGGSGHNGGRKTVLSHKWDWQVSLCVIDDYCVFPGKRTTGNVNNVVTFVCDKWICASSYLEFIY